MGKFLNAEKKRQATFKGSSAYFSEPARVDGAYRHRPYPFMLPTTCADENLFATIRQSALTYFAQHSIHWHMLDHLCSSQVCCVNFLFPFMDQPDALADLLRPIFPSLHHMLPLETPEQFVAFEWIGAENYLREKVRGNNSRTRGANFTSADAMVRFERDDGKRQIVLIEWKYTESYSSVTKKISVRGTDRSLIYAHLYDRDDCPLDKTLLPHYDALFYEPFYQFMRQQFLAQEMEQAHEFGADVVSLLHIAPAHNHEFTTVTSPELRGLGSSVNEVWKRLVRSSDRFASVSTETLFGKFPAHLYPQLSTWWDYLNTRYPWVKEQAS
jgi:hypothetical protein